MVEFLRDARSSNNRRGWNLDMNFASFNKTCLTKMYLSLQGCQPFPYLMMKSFMRG